MLITEEFSAMVFVVFLGMVAVALLGVLPVERLVTVA